jgi:hypothetical protein
VTAYAEWHLFCNHHDPDGAAGRKHCTRIYEPSPGSSLGTAAEVRKLAAKDGWTRVPLGRSYDRDLCPEHKPQEGTGD